MTGKIYRIIYRNITSKREAQKWARKLQDKGVERVRVVPNGKIYNVWGFTQP